MVINVLFSLLFWIQCDSQTSHLDSSSLGTYEIKSFRNKIDCWILVGWDIAKSCFGSGKAEFCFHGWYSSKLASHAHRRSRSIQGGRTLWFMFWGMWIPSKSEWASLAYAFEEILCCNMTREAAGCGSWGLDAVTPFSKHHHGTSILGILVSISPEVYHCILTQNMKVGLVQPKVSPSWMTVWIVHPSW